MTPHGACRRVGTASVTPHGACRRANKLTAKPQVGVDYRGQNTVKFVQNEKYSAKSADFLRFFAYLCHVIDDFACLVLQH